MKELSLLFSYRLNEVNNESIAYLAAGGLPEGNLACKKVAEASIVMQKAVGKFAIERARWEDHISK